MMSAAASFVETVEVPFMVGLVVTGALVAMSFGFVATWFRRGASW